MTITDPALALTEEPITNEEEINYEDMIGLVDDLRAPPQPLITNVVFDSKDNEIVVHGPIRLASKKKLKRKELKEAWRKQQSSSKLNDIRILENTRKIINEYNEGCTSCIKDYKQFKASGKRLVFKPGDIFYKLIVNSKRLSARFQIPNQLVGDDDKACLSEYVFRLLMCSNTLPKIFEKSIIKLITEELCESESFVSYRIHKYLRSFFNVLSDIKQQIQEADASINYIDSSVKDFGPLLDSVTVAENKFISFSKLNENLRSYIPYLYPRVSFRLPQVIIDAGRYGGRVIAQTIYTIKYQWNSESGVYQFSEIRAQRDGPGLGNPHTGHRTGPVCLGGYAYAVAQLVTNKEWGQLAYTLLQFHSTVDTSDLWGRRVVRNAAVFKDKQTSEFLIDSTKKSQITADINIRSVEEAYPKGCIIKGNIVYNADDYVECMHTKKIIQRKNAVRVTQYLSEGAVKELSGIDQKDVKSGHRDTHSVWGKLLKTLNPMDKHRLIKLSESLWSKVHKKNMNKYYANAKFFEYMKEREMQRQLNGDSSDIPF